MHQSNNTLPIEKKLSLRLALILVIVGMINTMPEIPGLQDFARNVTGQPFFRISNFSPEYFFPPMFF